LFNQLPPSQRTHRLANGLVLLGEVAPSFDSVAFSFLVPSGCVYERDEEEGLASLTCEMVLRGAGDRDNRALVTDLENLGVERSENVGVSQVYFGGSTLADSLPPALEIYADLLRRPRLPKAELESGKAVCLQEIRGVEDDPDQKLMSALRRRHYPSPWGRPSHGREESLTPLTIKDVERYYTSHYGPQETILAVAGSFDWDRLVEQVERLFGDWKSPAANGQIHTGAQPTDRYLPYESGQSHIGIAFPSVSYRDPDYFQAWSAVGVLSGGGSSRLFTEVREKRGLCYTVYASLQTQLDRAAVFCYAGTTAERAQETLDVTMAELLKLADGVTPEELSRLKARIKSSLIMQQESTAARSSAMARDWFHLGRVRPVSEVSAIIDAVTAETINDFLRKNPPRDFTIMTMGSAPLEMPHGIS
jgi:predicted Zn-dependent peptidase